MLSVTEGRMPSLFSFAVDSYRHHCFLPRPRVSWNREEKDILAYPKSCRFQNWDCDQVFGLGGTRNADVSVTRCACGEVALERSPPGASKPPSRTHPLCSEQVFRHVEDLPATWSIDPWHSEIPMLHGVEWAHPVRVQSRWHLVRRGGSGGLVSGTVVVCFGRAPAGRRILGF